MLAGPAAIDVDVSGPADSAEIRKALAASGVGTFAWDLAIDRFYLDPVACRLWGLPDLGECSAPQFLAAIEPEDQEALAAAAAAIRERGETGPFTFRVRRSGDEARRIEIRGHLTGSGAGRRFIGLALDTGASPATLDSAGEGDPSRRRARVLGGAIPFEWNAATGLLAAPPAFHELFGLPAADPVGFMDLLASVHPADRRRVETEHRRLLARPEPYEMDFRVLRADGRTRWVLARGDGVRSREGLVVGLAGIVIDVTIRKQVEDRMRQSRREARERFRELSALYNNAPVGLALLDRDLRLVRLNGAWAAMNGVAAEAQLGQPVFDLVPDLREVAEPLVRQVFETGQAVRDVEIQGEAAGAPGVRRTWREQFYPVADESGAVIGVGVVSEDITERKRVEQARDLLGRELSHRIKNLFAVVASIVSLSARGDERLRAFSRTVRSRIEALARAHDYVRPAEWDVGGGDHAGSLHGLLALLLAPYDDDASTRRIEVSGADPAIGPAAATALALAVHEFATNAVKYGALASAEGRIAVRCEDKDGTVEIAWRERGGPAVPGEPSRQGFGSTLARRTIGSDLGGTIAADWAREGLTLRLRVPREALAR